MRNMYLKRLSIGNKDQRTETRVCKFVWARLASFGHLGLISDLLIVSKFHKETHDLKGQENKIYTIVKDGETFYRYHIAVVKSNTFLKRISFRSKECTKELKLDFANLLGQAS